MKWRVKNLKRFKGIGWVVLSAALMISVGCRTEVQGVSLTGKVGNKITILSTKQTSQAKNAIAINGFDIEKIDRYEGIRGEDWLNEDTILITKENSRAKPILVEDQRVNARELYILDINSRVEKRLSSTTQYSALAIVSPDRKHIFTEGFANNKASGQILDVKGSVKAEVYDDVSKGFHISYNNARWVDNEEIIVPSSDDGVCLINVNSKVTRIKNIGRMQTDFAEKIGRNIFYISTSRKLIAYDIATKQRKVIMVDVLNFEASPKKDMIAVEKKIGGGKAELVLIGLNGVQKAKIIMAKMIFGISWSPDQSKIAYVITSEDESKKGLYITDIASNKSLYVSPDYVEIDNGLKWSPSGKKNLASIAEVKDMRAIDNTYVLSLH
jgi:TolB protein